jgi:hypothetical protein
MMEGGLGLGHEHESLGIGVGLEDATFDEGVAKEGLVFKGPDVGYD